MGVMAKANIVSLTDNLNTRAIYFMPFCYRNNECPACRTHCASRRSLRDDPRFDALIEILYEDIEKYEDEVKVYS